jgi:hypothetical protein
MIYRVVLRRGRDPDFANEPTGVGKWSFSSALNNEMLAMGFKAPDVKHVNPRARFYFTEWGWEVFGRKLYTLAIQRGYAPKVIRLKNPKRSDVVYVDSYQVAILPKKR